MPTLSRWPRTVVQLLAILVAILLLDAAAVGYVAFVRTPRVPTPPPFSSNALTAPLVMGVDAYSEMPLEFGFTTTPGRPWVPDGGRVRRLVGAAKVLDPDASLRYALAALAQHRASGDRRWLVRARTAVDEVVDVLDDGIVHHDIPRTNEHGEALPAGWVSAATQGLLLSALSRLYPLTGETSYRDLADEAFDSLLRTRGSIGSDGEPDPFWLNFVDENSLLWFEDAPQGERPSRVLTSHFTAVLGIYDYIQISTGQRRKVAVQVFGSGATTGIQFTPTVWHPFGPTYRSPDQLSSSLANHRALVAQLEALADITAVPVFVDSAYTYSGEASVPDFTVTGLVPRGDVDAYGEDRGTAALPPTDPPADPDPAGPERVAPPSRNPDRKLAQALADLAEYARSGDPGAKSSAASIVEDVLGSTTGGLVPHDFPVRGIAGRRLVLPWYSAQTQGLLLSALVRLEAATGEQRWADEAGAAFATFELSRSHPGHGPMEPPEMWLSVVGDDEATGRLWFEKFGRSEGDGSMDLPSYVVDAHNAALIGIYDYWRMTRSEEAAKLFDGGVSALVARLPDVRRKGGVSVSALALGTGRLDHHRVVTRQLALLAKMSGSKILGRQALLFARDAS